MTARDSSISTNSNLYQSVPLAAFSSYFIAYLIDIIYSDHQFDSYSYFKMNASSNYSKAFSRNSKSQQSLISQQDHAKRYQMVDRVERKNQREKVHKSILKKQRQSEKKREKHLMGQLAKKRQELMQLQQAQAEGMEEEVSEAHQNAKVKLEKERIKRIEKQLQNRQIKQTAKEREKHAQKWLDTEKKIVHKQEIQAKKLRETHFIRQKKERDQTKRMAKSMLLKRDKQQLAKKDQTSRDTQYYVKGINQHGIHKRPPGSHSHTHFVISKQNEEQNTAMKQAEEAKHKNQHIEKLKAEEAEFNREKAILRGQKAMERIREQRQYQNYCQETSQEQKHYNMSRIAAGKNNQYTGVKPMTLSQIEINKKQRGQAEFEQMFFKGKKLSSNTQTLASKYTVFEKKMKENKVAQEKPKPKPKQPINYMEQESLINNVSEGHYSFEEDKDWKQQPKNHQEEVDHEQQEYEKEEVPYPRPIMKETAFSKNQMKETRIPGQSRHKELDYSQSQQSMSQA